MFITSSSRMHERLRSGIARGVAALMVCLGLAGNVLAIADDWRVPGAISDRPDGWRMAGQGDLRWFGLRVYEAALWVQGDGGWQPGRPFALEIRYQRSISSARLVDASLSEMRRLGVADDVRIEGWREQLAAAFPDVDKGDVIVGVREDDGSAAFYHRDVLTVRIADEGFADAFFAIWLDERTREPKLRARLMGDTGDG